MASADSVEICLQMLLINHDSQYLAIRQLIRKSVVLDALIELVDKCACETLMIDRFDHHCRPHLVGLNDFTWRQGPTKASEAGTDGIDGMDYYSPAYSGFCTLGLNFGTPQLNPIHCD